MTETNEKTTKKRRTLRGLKDFLAKRPDFDSADKIEAQLVKLDALQRQHQKIVVLRKRADETGAQATMRKADYAQAQKAADAAEEALLAGLRTLDSIAGDEDVKATMPLLASTVSDAAPTATSLPGGDDRWRLVPLDEALPAVSRAKLTYLANANIVTLGDLADFSARGGQLSRDVAGIGRVAQAAIETAVGAYWAAHPRQNDERVKGKVPRAATGQPEAFPTILARA